MTTKKELEKAVKAATKALGKAKDKAKRDAKKAKERARTQVKAAKRKAKKAVGTVKSESKQAAAKGATATTGTAPVALADRTVTALRAQARAQKVPGYSRLSKEELLTKLR